MGRSHTLRQSLGRTTSRVLSGCSSTATASLINRLNLNVKAESGYVSEGRTSPSAHGGGCSYGCSSTANASLINLLNSNEKAESGSRFSIGRRTCASTCALCTPTLRLKYQAWLTYEIKQEKLNLAAVSRLHVMAQSSTSRWKLTP